MLIVSVKKKGGNRRVSAQLRAWSAADASSDRLISITVLFSGAHLTHSRSLSPRHRWWNECMHRKCTAGRSSGAWHAEQRLF